MEGYNSMVFYSSFYESVHRIPDDMPEYRLQLYDAILNYGLYGIEPELEWPLAMAWESIKPQIDANIKRRENGQKGGRKPTNTNQKETKPKPNPNLTITKSKPNVNDNVNANENNNINDNANDNDDDNDNTLPVAVKYYIDYINSSPSLGLINTIKGYIEEGMTDKCLIAIFEYCLDNNKRNWSYIKKVVEGCFNQGIRTEDDFRRSREMREQSMGTAMQEQTTHRIPAPPRKNSFHNFEQREYDPNEFDDIYFEEMAEFIKENKKGLTAE